MKVRKIRGKTAIVFERKVPVEIWNAVSDRIERLEKSLKKLSLEDFIAAKNRDFEKVRDKESMAIAQEIMFLYGVLESKVPLSVGSVLFGWGEDWEL